MGVNSSIALGVKPMEIENPMNALAQVMQLKNAQQSNALNAMSLDEKRRGLEDENQLRDLTRQAGGDMQKLRDLAYGAGNYKQGMVLDTALTNRKKAEAEAQNQQLDITRKRLDITGGAFTALKANPTPENAIATMDFLVQNKAMPPEQAQQFKEQISANPGGIAKMADQVSNWSMSTKDQLEQQWKAKEYTTPKADAVLSATTSTENNKRTVDASLENARATRDAASTTAKATRDAAQIKGNQDTEMKLGDDYRAQSKNFKETADAYKQITSVLDKATTSPAATLAGATKFMKMIDPGSVVRESELGMALAATGVFDRATNYFNTLASGKVLTAKQVEDFKAITKQINDAASTQQKLIDKHYTDVAKGYGLRPEMVVQDFGQNAPPPAPPTPALPKGWTVKAH